MSSFDQKKERKNVNVPVIEDGECRWLKTRCLVTFVLSRLTREDGDKKKAALNGPIDRIHNAIVLICMSASMYRYTTKKKGWTQPIGISLYVLAQNNLG